LDEVDRVRHALAPTKDKWSDMIDEIDLRHRCNECSGIVGRDLNASLLKTSIALSDLIDGIEQHVAHADLMQRAA
jgi:hypothetical protein